MKAADMHCDTIAQLYAARGDGKSGRVSNTLAGNSFHVDIEKMRTGDYLMQNFALYVDKEETDSPLKRALEMTDLYYGEMERCRKDIAPVFCCQDIEENRKQGKISAMLTVEEGGILEGSLAQLRNFYRLGVRMIALTWNYENEIGYPNLTFDQMGRPRFARRNARGLKGFGIEVIQEMEDLGMVIDVSHLSDGGFWDVMRYTKAPFVASHSNAASLCPVCRNLTDDMIRALGERGGVAGLNFCRDFLREQEEPGPSRIADMTAHLRHMSRVGGIEVCGLGSDFDGISDELELGDASGMQMLAEALHRDGFAWDDIEKIFNKNVLRVYREVLG